ncbi:beta-lactamase family protein [Aureisphaera sp. CAU 1614]|uniref:Beta-lactamase family protein n=1 Tax=Halomarinibacterium sedimenti TaxID=2857106 RepID=A0A9X1JVJ9_9FLAO|nr:serine hydrolase domain-containing protein [Halomarinibacterium sedimenti]MBW2938059.1 beta-lactamase family protein [Halomarinibacterium sedimenti]
MKRVLHFFILGFLFLFLFFSCNQNSKKSNASIELNETLVKKLDSIGQKYIKENKTMGISIAVVKKGEVLYNGGFGFIDSLRTIPVTNDNIFAIASISKLVGVTMTMKLVEENKISLDNTLFELLPDFPNKEQAKKIKLKHLISNTSGIKDYAIVIDSVYLKTGINPTKEDYYKFFAEHTLDFEPGSNFNYSNSGFLLMAMIIEEVTGKKFEDELDRIINKPANLNLKLISENIHNPFTSSYFELKDSLMMQEPLWTWIKGDGGLTTTSVDLASFPSKWANGQIISKESFELMKTPFILNDGLYSGYGLGVRTGNFEGEYVIGHTGGHKSSWAVMKYFPSEELSVVVFVNTDNTPTDALTIAGFISLAALGKEAPVLQDIEKMDYNLDKYTGVYQSFENYYNSNDSISIIKYDEDPHLYRKSVTDTSRGRKLYYMGNNSFAYDGYVMDRIVFDSDNKGQIVAYKEYWNGLFKGGIYRKKK